MGRRVPAARAHTTMLSTRTNEGPSIMSEALLRPLHEALRAAYFGSAFHSGHYKLYAGWETERAIRDVFERHLHELNLCYVKTPQGREHAVEDIVSQLEWNRQKEALQRRWSRP